VGAESLECEGGSGCHGADVCQRWRVRQWWRTGNADLLP
jgi:hypothetical protein